MEGMDGISHTLVTHMQPRSDFWCFALLLRTREQDLAPPHREP
jgi:hypothetical protein